jgi:hypothetical protein
MKILGFAKIGGALTIATGRYPTLKGWAYAGFSFEFLGAAASHVLAGDSAHAPIPFIFFLLIMGSYLIWNRVSVEHDQRARSHAKGASAVVNT